MIAAPAASTRLTNKNPGARPGLSITARNRRSVEQATTHRERHSEQRDAHQRERAGLGDRSRGAVEVNRALVSHERDQATEVHTDVDVTNSEYAPPASPENEKLQGAFEGFVKLPTADPPKYSATSSTSMLR